ncbi:sulfatase-like hydrolase/transferase [Nocardioides convexus]|uniref:sulfatase-like hydrolase/transferase n=1 Tax=Nocardioides convexus TaxID=2712224 RepID=UPI002418522D|nr:sulfatase-like hydrolase/transferase [Nocardioides convexus]
MAASGVRFTQGYSAGAVCSPTRIALYTGRHPGRIPGGLQEPIGRANDRDGIPPSHPTLASLLKGAGYSTHMVGKWHGGFLPTFGPLKSGWDTFYGNYSGGLDYFSKYAHNGLYDLYDGETRVEDPRYYTDILTEKATAVIRAGAREHRPWLFNLNFTAPHWPWEGPGDKAVSDESHGATAGRRHPGAVPQRRRLAGQVQGARRAPRSLDRQGARRAAPHRPGPGHDRALRQRQRRRAVQPTTGPSPATRPASTRAGSGCR